MRDANRHHHERAGRRDDLLSAHREHELTLKDVEAFLVVAVDVGHRAWEGTRGLEFDDRQGAAGVRAILLDRHADRS